MNISGFIRYILRFKMFNPVSPISSYSVMQYCRAFIHCKP